ncbi:hypothetical protein RDABS01_019398 [Bienertia sinuspersici]
MGNNQIHTINLVSRSLFERSPSNKGYYVMHDLVHDLSQWAAGDICHCVTGTMDMQNDLKRTRHLNLSVCTNVTERIDQTILRTFICRTKGNFDHKSSVEFQDFISRFRCLRTLYLTSETIEGLPKCIGDLKHLRYLNLEFTKVKVLPKSIRNLCNLQVLILSGCCNLRKATNIRFLVKLRHLRFHQCLWEAMPQGIRYLTELQTLGEVYLGDNVEKGSMIRELKNLSHLQGQLRVIGLQNVRKVEDAKEAQLYEKKGVRKLNLNWSGDAHDDIEDNTKRDVLEELKPSSSIKACELNGYMGLTLPSWLVDPSFENMVDIKLVKCEKCQSLPPMWQLPLLKKLWIEGMKEWVGWSHDSKEKFPCLEDLIIHECETFQGCLPPYLPLLKVLTIKECPRAIVLPPNSPHLELLKIGMCEALSSASRKVTITYCSKKLSLKQISSGFTELLVDCPCRDKLKVEFCDSLVTINKIPVMVGCVFIGGCEKLEKIEFDKSSTSTASKKKKK